MDWNAQLKLQAFLDGELPEAEAREVADRLARDPESAALLTELRQTRDALAGFEQGTELPETREFFWSKIERDIHRLAQPAPAPAPVAASWIAGLRRFLVPVTAVAVLAIAGIVATRQSGPPGLKGRAEIETALADPGAFTYHDYASGTTLVWFSYPAEKEIADEVGGVRVQ